MDVLPHCIIPDVGIAFVDRVDSTSRWDSKVPIGENEFADCLRIQKTSQSRAVAVDYKAMQIHG